MRYGDPLISSIGIPAIKNILLPLILLLTGPAPAPDPISDSVVHIHVTNWEPDFARPWAKGSPKQVTGSGVIIEGKRILTNSHVVNYAIRRGDMDLRFDVNSDEIVDHHDRAFLIWDILPTQEGDANLDGEIDFNDFQTLSNNVGAVDAAYTEGDFTGDGIVGFSDFVILSNNCVAS